MSAITVERPAAAAPAPSWSTGWWNLALRGALLVVLVGAAAVAAPSLHPRQGSPQMFLDTLRSGSARHIEYDTHNEELRWSVAWSNWYQVDLSLGHPAVAGDSGTDTGSVPDEDWIRHALKQESPQRADFRVVDSGDHLVWAQRLPWQGLGTAATLAVGAAFLLMLLRREHRYGNRWAWFWVMASTSGLGAALYLALEPAPVWQKPSRQRPLPLRPLFLGGAGLLIAIALKPALALLALLVSAS